LDDDDDVLAENNDDLVNVFGKNSNSKKEKRKYNH
jgi:hypothetical protein